jgi:hypothetical protein
MVQCFKMLVGLTVLTIFMSCSTSYESKGDISFNASKKSTGDNQRRLQKEAYLYYNKALKAHPDKISNRLRNHFLEATTTRAQMMLSEGSAHMDALPLFIEEIDAMLTADVDPSIRSAYVNFLMQLADSAILNEKIYKGLGFIDHALEVATDKAEVQKKKNEIVDNLAKQNLDIAQSEFVAGTEDKNTEALLRAEYRVKLAMFYQKDLPGAAELLSKLRQANLATYSAYQAVITDRPDTLIFRKIDEFDILLAIPTQKGATYIVDMYNYSWNPLRLRPSNFAIVNEAGDRFPAAAGTKIDKEILEQQHEIKITMSFPGLKGKPQKLIYESDDKEHYTEKYFY